MNENKKFVNHFFVPNLYQVLRQNFFFTAPQVCIRTQKMETRFSMQELSPTSCIQVLSLPLSLS